MCSFNLISLLHHLGYLLYSPQIVPLPHLRTLQLSGLKWHLHPGMCQRPFEGEPFCRTLDTFLEARTSMGAPLAELHLHDIRFLDEAHDMDWFQSMSGMTLQFTWQRCPPYMDSCGPVACGECRDNKAAFFEDSYDYYSRS